MVSFMREEREMMVSAMETQRQEMQALLEQERAAKERERAEKEERGTRLEVGGLRAEALASKLREQQLAALQSRVESLHARDMLTDEELYKLEDLVADSLENEEPGGGSGGLLLTKLVALSERVAGDAALARQLRRQFS
jgi:hypothetical protein